MASIPKSLDDWAGLIFVIGVVLCMLGFTAIAIIVTVKAS